MFNRSKLAIIVLLAFIISHSSSSPSLGASYDYLYHQGKSSEATGDFQTAQQFYEKAIKLNKNKIEARYALAKVLSWKEETRSRALQLYQGLSGQAPNRADILLDYANTLYWNQQYDKALQLVDTLLRRSPKNISYLHLRSDILLAAGQRDQSLETTNKILLLDPTNKEALINKANIYYWKGDFSIAAKYYEDLIAKNIRSREIWTNYIYSLIYADQYYLAESLLETEKDAIAPLEYLKAKAKIKYYTEELASAEEFYRLAYDQSPYDTDLAAEYTEVLILNKKFSQAKDIINTMRTVDPTSYKVVKSLGDLYFAREEYSIAVDQYLKAYDDNPNDPALLKKLASAYLFLKNYKQVETLLETKQQVLSRNDYFKILARTRFEQGQLQDAWQFYQMAIALNPNNKYLKREYADVLIRLKKLNEAETVLLSIAENQKDLKETFILLAKNNLYEKNYEKSHDYLDKAIAITPNDPEPYFIKGESEFYQGNLESALAFYKQAYEKPNGQTDNIIKRIAELSSYLKDVDTAKAMFEELKSAYPQYKTEAQLGIGRAYLYSGNLYDAKASFEKVLTFDPGNKEALLGIARIHNDLNQMLTAIKILEPLLTLHPQDNEIKETLARSYTRLGRKDKAISIIGKAYLEENHTKDLYLEEVYWANRNAIIPKMTFMRESGDINNKLSMETYGASINLYPRENVRLTGEINVSPFRAPKADDRTGIMTTYAVETEIQATNRLNLQGKLGLSDFTESGFSGIAQASTRYRVNDNFILRGSYNRTPIAESFLSLAGLTPSSGPYANSLVGQVTNNEFALTGTLLAPYYKFDATGQYFAGFNQGEQLPTNFYQGFFTNVGVLLVARDTYNPINVVRLSNSTRFITYEDDLSGFGGVDLRANPFGLDGGAIMPIPSLQIPGTGGYFSPGYAVSSVFGLDINGYFRDLRLGYRAGIAAGFQNVKYNSTEFVYQPGLDLQFNPFGHVGLNLSYLYSHFGAYDLHNFGSYLLFRF